MPERLIIFGFEAAQCQEICSMFVANGTRAIPCHTQADVSRALCDPGVIAVLLDTRAVVFNVAVGAIKETRASGCRVPVFAVISPCENTYSQVCELVRIGVDDLLMWGQCDPPTALRHMVRANDEQRKLTEAMAALCSRFPCRLQALVSAVRDDPANCTQVREVARRMGIGQSTLSEWCRRDGVITAEETITWTRLVLASTLMSHSRQPIKRAAELLGYPTAAALRRVMRRYLGKKAGADVCAKGPGLVLGMLDQRLSAARHCDGSEPRAEVRRAANTG